MRTLTSIAGNTQRLDGGAMFGNAPKVLWQRWISPDEQNRIPLACRAMLVRDDDRQVLFEAGIGVFFEPKLKDRFGVVEDDHMLLRSLEAAGTSHEAIDVVVLSHLHFDHAGGLLTPFAEGESHRLLFPKARFVVGKKAWARALAPHPRDRASFIPELITLLEESGRLEVVEGETSEVLGEGYRFHYSDGHTPGLMLTEVAMPGGPIVFAGDLVPGVPWVHLPITMGYDRYPEILIDEKRALYEELVPKGLRLFFTHDPDTALGTVVLGDKHRYGVGEKVAAPREIAR
jgi:glyoxylase-like metal-dependent hydrolase (beta-lactamase superfamily II)